MEFDCSIGRVLDSYFGSYASSQADVSRTSSKARSEVSVCVIFSRYPSQICWICDTDLQELVLPNYCLSEVFLYISFAGTFPVF